MERIDTVIIGGGQAGLAMSRALSERGVEHVVLERGRVGERWRSERWDSLTLLTPRWLSRVSGWRGNDRGQDPHGFMDRLELVRYLTAFARHHGVPLRTGVRVLSVTALESGGYRVETDHGAWAADRVVVATGQSQASHVPELARSLDPGIHQVVPTDYRNPAQLPSGGVLVVGASATGIQLADEIHASGRPVTLAVGRHTRLPRSYRGRDILGWLHDMGILDQRAREVENLAASRDQPSMQLVGSPDRRTLDLAAACAAGIRLVGRARGADGCRVALADDLVETLAGAEFKLAGLRLRIDRHIRDQGLEGEVTPPDPFDPVPLPASPETLDLRQEGIRTVLWATGFRRSYPWLHVPVLDSRGEIRHTGGITSSPGLYVLGLNFLRRRSSSFLAGVGQDAQELSDHIAAVRSGTLRDRAVA
ncbi:MAG TPA: NAD(P)/FAD-dependent oxidoreductase [Longimicrobiales bacterium]|nr:NAD(P)/FAD-dependent oxidoreductase [Longimicrobiales bacterium]